MMTVHARGWEQRVLQAATEATNGAWLIKKNCFEAMRLEAHLLADLRVGTHGTEAHPKTRPR
jgi:hypothetical protein